MFRDRVRTFVQHTTRKIEDALLKIACRIVVRFVHRRIGCDCKISFGMDGQVRVDPLFPDEFIQDTLSRSMYWSLQEAANAHVNVFGWPRECLACKAYGTDHPGYCRTKPLYDEFGRAR